VGNKGRQQGHEARGFTLAGYASFGPTKEATAQQKASRDMSLRPGAAETRAALIRSIFLGKKITHLTIRLSRTDWWAWISSPAAGAADAHEALRLEPMINVTDRQDTCCAMQEGYEARSAGREEVPDFGLDEFEMQGRWGMQFAEHWPDLQTLELVLESHVQKESQLDKVVKCARLWTFPLDGGKRLEWNGEGERSVRWRVSNAYDYDDELGLSWVNDQPEPQRDETPVMQWRPTTNDEPEIRAGQEFIMKSLVFTRRRSVDNTYS
jgi:hypothetical protein